jgi:hypothetical protein
MTKTFDLLLTIRGHRFRFYRRKVGSKMVFSLYVDGTSVWQLVDVPGE